MSAGGIEVEVDLAGPETKPIFGRLLELYFHDFSEMYPPEAWTIGEDGVFGPYEHLDGYWPGPERRPLLIHAGGLLAGFALVNAHSWRGAPIDHAMAEFFILRQHRRSGVGRQAAQAIFHRYPGRWELAIAKANTAAHAFWPRTVLETTGVDKLTMWRIADRDRTILDFEVRG